MKTKTVIYALGMLLTGSINTIATKYQVGVSKLASARAIVSLPVIFCSALSVPELKGTVVLQDITVVGHDAEGRPITFQHPVIQSAFMFLGEFLCLIPYAIISWRKQYVQGTQSAFQKQSGSNQLKALFSFGIPAVCDAGATTMLNVGLFYTFASVFQMLRGTLVVFAGLLTILILKRRLHIHHWLGIVLIAAGAALVGASSLLSARKAPAGMGMDAGGAYAWLPSPASSSMSGQGGSPPPPGHTTAKNPLIGDIFVVTAQLAAATQFIIEEKYLTTYRVPALLAVGLEGMWGLIISAAALPAMSFVRWPDGTPVDVLSAAIREIRGSRQLQLSTLGSVASIAFFNFFGISVTKGLSGAARATIDACRTLFIWIFSLSIGWERFHGLEVLGFLVLLAGTSIYNELIRTWLPDTFSRTSSLDLTQEPLLGGASTPPPPTPGRPPLAPAPSRPMQAGPGRTSSVQARPQTIVGSMYTLARSMRLFPTALSPHSLTSPTPFQPGLRYEAASGDPVLPTSSPSPSDPSVMREGGEDEEEAGLLRGSSSARDPGRQHSLGGRRR